MVLLDYYSKNVKGKFNVLISGSIVLLNLNSIIAMVLKNTLKYQNLLLFLHVWKCIDAAAIMYMSIKTQFSLMNN